MTKRKQGPSPRIIDSVGPLVEKLTVQLNLKPQNERLFLEAFTHSSFANEHGLNSNERLEFLGDSVLGVIVCQFLFNEFKQDDEGKLAKLKSLIVSAPFLASFCRKLGLEQHILLGQGELRTGGNKKPNILADLFEAFIGAYFLNFGLAETAKLILPLISESLPEIIAHYQELDAKTCLQEYAQSKGLKPEYKLVKEEGPAHQRQFSVEVRLNNRIIGTGTASSLKKAQSRAALSGLAALQKEN